MTWQNRAMTEHSSISDWFCHQVILDDAGPTTGLGLHMNETFFFLRAKEKIRKRVTATLSSMGERRVTGINKIQMGEWGKKTAKVNLGDSWGEGKRRKPKMEYQPCYQMSLTHKCPLSLDANIKTWGLSERVASNLFLMMWIKLIT